MRPSRSRLEPRLGLARGAGGRPTLVGLAGLALFTSWHLVLDINKTKQTPQLDSFLHIADKNSTIPNCDDVWYIAMPPARKRTSSEPEAEPNARDENDPQTPGSPPQKKLRITQNQKQALIDNLQLESMHTILYYTIAMDRVAG